MKQILFSLYVAALFCTGCGNGKDTKGTASKDTIAVSHVDQTLVTDSSWGSINSTTDIEALRKLFGNSSVKDERICGAECIDSVDVTIIHDSLPNSMVIYWTDSGYHKTIAMIRAGDTAATFHTASGLKVGSTMQDLLRFNGKKITFYGFGWDYGGYVSSYNGGAMEKSHVNFRLDLKNGEGGLYGDGEFNTDEQKVKNALGKIRITEISLSFD